MKRGDRVTWVPPWAHQLDREHPDREYGIVVGIDADSARVRFKDHNGEHVERCSLKHLEPR